MQFVERTLWVGVDADVSKDLFEAIGCRCNIGTASWSYPVVIRIGASRSSASCGSRSRPLSPRGQHGAEHLDAKGRGLAAVQRPNAFDTVVGETDGHAHTTQGRRPSYGPREI